MTSTTIAAPDDGGSGETFEGLPGVGDVVEGKYSVEGVLGTGGMGVVVAARHLSLGERVAIKFLLPRAAKDRGAMERFMREARASARIKNEHVVRVMDAGRLPSGAPYILMEFLEGVDLASVLRTRRTVSVAEAIDYVLQACEAIAEAHTLGIIHRDLKPSNLFLTQRSDGTPCIKVLDFGISKALVEGDGSDPALTDTQAVFGSPAYMSPEQIRSAKRVDPRTDVWSLGVILFELLTGQMPFNGEHSAALLASISADQAPRMRTLRPDLEEGLDFVVARCLEKEPARRIQSIAELARSIAPFARLGSRSSVDRIERISVRARSPSSFPCPAPVAGGASPSGRPSGPTQTQGTWTPAAARPSRAPGGRRIVWIAGAVLAGTLAVALGSVVILRRSGNSGQGTAPSPSDAPRLGAPSSSPPAPAIATPAAVDPAKAIASPTTTTSPVLTPGTSTAHRSAPLVHVSPRTSASAAPPVPPPVVSAPHPTYDPDRK